uniref:Amidohydrolase-related domain-containing protein n=1 Tax=Ditylenchus dipsaci TaxID=166011 RepID=A0A915E764_9BILA
MDFCGKVIHAPLIWFDGHFQPDIQIQVRHDGIITAIGKDIVSSEDQLDTIKDVALLPGFVNAHSHSFHRYLRGRSDIGTTAADSFWKWRNNMYALLDGVTYHTFKEFCKGTFQEMLSANQRFDLDNAVVEAALEVGIRLVLIETLYSRSGFHSNQLTQQQLSFGAELEEFMKHVESLSTQLIGKSEVSIAVAAHSLRAVPIPIAQELWEWANQQQFAFHIHLEEQPRKWRTVFLGDGIPELTEKDKLCLGTDCNNRICFLEEMRWLCFCQNMKKNSRIVLN